MRLGSMAVPDSQRSTMRGSRATLPGGRRGISVHLSGVPHRLGKRFRPGDPAVGRPALREADRRRGSSIERPKILGRELSSGLLSNVSIYLLLMNRIPRLPAFPDEKPCAAATSLEHAHHGCEIRIRYVELPLLPALRPKNEVHRVAAYHEGSQRRVASPWLPLASAYRSEPTRSDPASSIRNAAASTRALLGTPDRRSTVTRHRAAGSIRRGSACGRI